MPPGAEIIVHRCTIKIKNELLGLYAIRFLFCPLSNRVTNIVEILVVLDVIRLKFESGAREGGGGGGEERTQFFQCWRGMIMGKESPVARWVNKSPLKLVVSFHKKIN